MNLAQAKGHTIGALAIVAVDNPLCAATGHRICNDCMKACIYQKQEPVNIPQVESRTLKDVLALPWGFEIYALLYAVESAQFQPDPFQSLQRAARCWLSDWDRRVLRSLIICVNDGHTVVGIDGLKIEPLAPRSVGRRSFRPPIVVPSASRCWRNSRGARSTDDGGLRRCRRVRYHRAVGQEQSQDH